MPSSQALLHWLKEEMPKQFGQVLARARELDRAAALARLL
jgi:hypothetical protein